MPIASDSYPLLFFCRVWLYVHQCWLPGIYTGQRLYRLGGECECEAAGHHNYTNNSSSTTR